MTPRIFDDEVLGWLGPIPVTMTMVTSVAASLLVLAFALLASRAVRNRPGSRLAALGRITHRFLSDLVAD